MENRLVNLVETDSLKAAVVVWDLVLKATLLKHFHSSIVENYRSGHQWSHLTNNFIDELMAGSFS